MTRSHILATHTIEDADGEILQETECRIHFTFTPGCPAQLYGDAPHPEEGPEVEFSHIERKDGKRWERVTADSELEAWAFAYLADNMDEAIGAVADDRERVLEEMADMRRDEMRMEDRYDD
jgi:hypothetical protein